MAAVPARVRLTVRVLVETGAAAPDVGDGEDGDEEVVHLARRQLDRILRPPLQTNLRVPVED